MLRTITLLLGFFALSCSPVLSETYYVAPLDTKISGTPAGTESQPFLSIGAALKSGKVKGGDTLLLKDGAYGAVTIKTNAAFDVPVTIMSQNGKAAHFDSILLALDTRKLILRNLSVWPRDPGKGTNYLVRAYETTSDITLDGMEVRSEKDAAGYMSWDAGKWEARKYSGILLQGPRGKVLNSQLTGINHGIMVGNDSQIISNTIVGFNGDGMRAASNSLVKNNSVYNCVKTNGNHDDGFQGINAKNLTLDSNIIIEWNGNPNHPLRCTLQGIGFFGGEDKNLTIVNNLVVVSSYHGISIYGVQGARVLNNTVVHSKGLTLAYPYIAIRPTKSGVNPTDVLVANNLAMSVQGKTSAKDRVEFRNNSAIGTPALVFKNPAAFDYRPKASSSYIDTADPSLAPPTDLTGQKRPSGKGPDRGAYEVSMDGASVSPEVVSPTPPSVTTRPTAPSVATAPAATTITDKTTAGTAITTITSTGGSKRIILVTK